MNRRVKRWSFWGASAAVAVAGHVAAGAALLASNSVVEDEAPGGALVVELAPVLTTVAAPDQQLPLGPQSADSAESAPSTPPPEPVKEEASDPVPVDTSPVEPEVALPDPKPKEQKTTEEPAPVVTETEPRESAASSASVAAAPPKIEAPPAEKAVAPSVGTSPREERARMSWHRHISTHLERFKRYPKGAGVSGTVVVEFTVGRNGELSAKAVHQSSSVTPLDEAALDLLARASPLPAVPKDIAGESFTLRVPIIYQR